MKEFGKVICYFMMVVAVLSLLSSCGYRRPLKQNNSSEPTSDPEVICCRS